jgi:mRNA interferase MazF
LYWVDFRGALGAEIRKTRPAVVVSSDDHNDHMRTITVAPFSSKSRGIQPQEVVIPAGLIGDGRPSRIRAHQLRAVDRSRLGRKLGVLPHRLMRELETTLREHLGIAG